MGHGFSIHFQRVLLKDRSNALGSDFEIFGVVVEMMIEAQGEIDNLLGFGDDLGAASESREDVSDIAVVLLDGDGEVLAGEELRFRDDPVKPVPVVGDEGFAFQSDLVEEFAAGRVITATSDPGQGSPSDRVKGSPNPELSSLF